MIIAIYGMIAEEFGAGEEKATQLSVCYYCCHTGYCHDALNVNVIIIVSSEMHFMLNRSACS